MQTRFRTKQQFLGGWHTSITLFPKAHQPSYNQFTPTVTKINPSCLLLTLAAKSFSYCWYLITPNKLINMHCCTPRTQIVWLGTRGCICRALFPAQEIFLCVCIAFIPTQGKYLCKCRGEKPVQGKCLCKCRDNIPARVKALCKCITSLPTREAKLCNCSSSLSRCKYG